MKVSSNNVSSNNVSSNNESIWYNSTHSDIYEATWTYVETYRPILYATLLSPIICFGIVGNVLSILVWNKGKQRMITTSRFMTALALADILVLSMTATVDWLKCVLRIYIFGYSVAMCQASQYFYRLPRVISAWILVIATVERAIRLWMPHRVRLACRPSIDVAMIALVCGLLSVAYFPFFTELDFVEDSSMCFYKESSIMHTNYDTSKVFDMCMFFVCPFSIILVCNLSILIKINKSRQAVQASGGQTTGNGGGRHMLRTVTWRIIGLCLTFCVCICPNQINDMFTMESLPWTSTSILWYYIRSDIFHIIMFLNNGVNFILYCMIGSGFRKDLMAICKCRKST